MQQALSAVPTVPIPLWHGATLLFLPSSLRPCAILLYFLHPLEIAKTLFRFLFELMEIEGSIAGY